MYTIKPNIFSERDNVSVPDYKEALRRAKILYKTTLLPVGIYDDNYTLGIVYKDVFFLNEEIVLGLAEEKYKTYRALKESK